MKQLATGTIGVSQFLREDRRDAASASVGIKVVLGKVNGRVGEVTGVGV